MKSFEYELMRTHITPLLEKHGLDRGGRILEAVKQAHAVLDAWPKDIRDDALELFLGLIATTKEAAAIAAATAEPLDWKAAQEHLELVERNYRMLIGLPGVNASFMLDQLDGIRRRFNRGERTPEFHAHIMELSES